MADQGSTTTQAAAEGKGKSKAENPPEEVSMDDGDDSSDEESGIEEPVEEPEEEDADNMEEINTNNIINDGRRTRGKKIDFTKANTDDLGDDDDDADDADFEAKEEAGDVDMQD